MKDSRLDKIEPLSGVLSVVLILIATAIYNMYEYLPAPEKMVEYLSSNPTRTALAGYLGAISGFFLIWFAGVVRGKLLDYEGGGGRLSTISFGGGLAAGIFMIFGFTVMATSGQRAGSGGGISPAQAVTLYDLQSQVMGQMFAVGMAVMMAAAASVSLRSDMFPSWFGWVTVLLAVGHLTPISYIFLFFGVAWIVVLSVWLYSRGKSTA